MSYSERQNFSAVMTRNTLDAADKCTENACINGTKIYCMRLTITASHWYKDAAYGWRALHKTQTACINGTKIHYMRLTITASHWYKDAAYAGRALHKTQDACINGTKIYVASTDKTRLMLDLHTQKCVSVIQGRYQDTGSYCLLFGKLGTS